MFLLPASARLKFAAFTAALILPAVIALLFAPRFAFGETSCQSCKKKITVNMYCFGVIDLPGHWTVTLLDQDSGESFSFQTGIEVDSNSLYGYEATLDETFDITIGHNFVFSAEPDDFEGLDTPIFHLAIPRTCSQPSSDYAIASHSEVQIPLGSQAGGSLDCGGGQGQLGSVDFRWGMGRTRSGAPAGDLRLTQSSITAASFSPATIYTEAAGGGQIEGDYFFMYGLMPWDERSIRARVGLLGKDLKEVRLPGALALLQPLPDKYGFSIKFYYYFSVDSETGFSMVDDNLHPAFAVWRVFDPDAPQGSTTRINRSRLSSRPDRRYKTRD
jgi:hypothetical protein